MGKCENVVSAEYLGTESEVLLLSLLNRLLQCKEYRIFVLLNQFRGRFCFI